MALETTVQTDRQAIVTLKDLYRKLKELGIDRAFAERYGLPSWWTEECKALPDASVIAASYFARRFGLKLTSLLDPETAATPFCLDVGGIRYKTAQNQKVEAAALATHLAKQVANVAAYAYSVAYQSMAGRRATEIRAAIHARGQIVNLESLLTFCLDQGLLVLHVGHFPKSCSRFHGMVAHELPNPYIVLSFNHASPSRLAFVLAHELGHLALGHVLPGDTLSEEEIAGGEDTEEMAANAFACELLLGAADRVYDFSQNANFIQKIQEAAQRDRNDPGIIACNYGYHFQKMGFVQSYLKALEDKVNAPTLIHQKLSRYLDWAKLSDDNLEYLRQWLNAPA